MFLSMQPLSLKTYTARFSTLLYAEELQMEVDMREFDMERVRIFKFVDHRNIVTHFNSLKIIERKQNSM